MHCELRTNDVPEHCRRQFEKFRVGESGKTIRASASRRRRLQLERAPGAPSFLSRRCRDRRCRSTCRRFCNSISCRRTAPRCRRVHAAGRGARSPCRTLCEENAEISEVCTHYWRFCMRMDRTVFIFR